MNRLLLLFCAVGLIPAGFAGPREDQLRKDYAGLNRSSKVGYFTGEFGPFTDGHLAVAQTALEKGELDRIFVIPTPHPTNDPKVSRFSRAEWGERIMFAKLATEGDPRIRVWPSSPELFSDMRPELGDLINALEAANPTQGKLTHVMGGDSLYRVISRSLALSDPRPRIVVTRPGVAVPDLDDLEAHQIKVISNLVQTPISATGSLHELAAGMQPTYVKKRVVDYLLSLPRYKSIIEELQRNARELREALSKAALPKNPVYIFDPVQNYAGLYTGVAPMPTEHHRALLLELAAQPNAQVLVNIINSDLNSEARTAWAKLLGQLKDQKVKLTESYLDIKPHRRVRVIHSGIATGYLETGFFSEGLAKGYQYLIFETNDAPTSKLLQSTGIAIYREGTGFAVKPCPALHAKFERNSSVP